MGTAASAVQSDKGRQRFTCSLLCALQPSSIFADNRNVKRVTITDARKRFGALLDAVQHEPVLICRNSRKAAVIMSAEQYARFRDVEGFQPKPTRGKTGRKSR